MAQIILISGLQRSGTTLIHRLFDGHSQLWVMPSETGLHANKYVWPNLAPAVRHRRFNLCYEFGGAVPIWNYFRSAKLKKLQKNFEVENPDFDLDFEAFLEDWRRAVESQADWTEGRILEFFFLALFANLRSHPRRNTDRIVIKTPRLGFEYQRFFELFPDGRLIFMTRGLEGYVSSEMKRSLIPQGGIIDRLRRMRLIVQLCRFHSFSRKVFFELVNDQRVRVVEFEKLTSETEATMRAIAEFVGVPFEETLTKPTIYGELWIANSSFEQDRDSSGVHRLVERRPILSPVERTLLRVAYRLLPPASNRVVFGTR